MSCSSVLSGVVTVIPYLIVLLREPPATCITLACIFEVDSIRGCHTDWDCLLKTFVYITDVLFQHLNELLADVFTLALLGVVGQFGFVDAVVETLDVVAESRRVMLLILGCG